MYAEANGGLGRTPARAAGCFTRICPHGARCLVTTSQAVTLQLSGGPARLPHDADDGRAHPATRHRPAGRPHHDPGDGAPLDVDPEECPGRVRPHYARPAHGQPGEMARTRSPPVDPLPPVGGSVPGSPGSETSTKQNCVPGAHWTGPSATAPLAAARTSATAIAQASAARVSTSAPGPRPRPGSSSARRRSTRWTR
jgi:hypothetical protein